MYSETGILFHFLCNYLRHARFYMYKLIDKILRPRHNSHYSGHEEKFALIHYDEVRLYL